MNDFEYCSEKTYLVPYDQRQMHFFPEDFLVSLYFRCKEQNLIDTIFPGMRLDHLNRFVSYMSAHPMQMLFAREGDQITDTVGFGYVVESEGAEGARKASIGFAFFKEWHGKKEVRELSRFLMAWWFKELKIDVLFGTILASNKIAINFAEHFGFRNLGVIPKLFCQNGELVDSVLVTLDKDEFIPKYEAWRSVQLLDPIPTLVQ